MTAAASSRIEAFPPLRPAIAVVAFNRPDSLSRLLGALDRASYTSRPTLFISIDGGAPQSVVDTARNFRSSNLDVRVLHNDVHLGLRRHILQCGDLSIDHGAVIVLEDDLYVDPYYYQYACAATSYFAYEDIVAGIALYSQEYNEYVNLPFHPMRNGTSCFPMQVPCSWGQCWTKAQWTLFKEWYRAADARTVAATAGLPEQVKRWPETSWKKYFAAYLVESGKYFIYPYESFTTNCSDAGGTHIALGTSLHHAALSWPGRPRPAFTFTTARKSAISYDAYMEPNGTYVDESIGVERDQVAVNHYLSKSASELKRKTYVLSRKRYGIPVQCYHAAYRPIEANFSHRAYADISDGLYLCRTSEVGSTSADTAFTMSAFSYYAKMPLLSRRIVSRAARELPGALSAYVLARCRRLIRRIWRRGEQ